MNPPQQRDPNSTHSYTVAWICALEEEYFCASRMLDEEFDGPKIIEDNDDNTYIYGRVAQHLVVIGCLPAGQYGTNSAARVARDMVRTFPHLRFALMVGIGGGAPTTQNDIRLGDVVVSQPHGFLGGVVQYDLGKLKDGRFEKTGQLNAPPKLLGVIPEMRRLYNDKRKPDRLAEHLLRLEDMEDYQRPAVDRLYMTNYPHKDGQKCDKCDSRSIINRPERQNHRALYVHYGNIASGNLVLKDAAVRDEYANDPALNILCFEMEAAGLMNNVPCLVIRGICDYCDSHKNDDWHKYAALVAAAYARELLHVLRPQRVDAMSPWAEQVTQKLEQVQQELTSLSDTQSAVLTGIERLDLKFDWGKVTAQGAAFDSYANQHEDLCLPGTRTDLLRQVLDWVKSPNGKCMFWLNGRAGTGKSTISRSVTTMLNDTSLLGASFFFKRGESDRGSAKRLFPTIASQLLKTIPRLVPGVQKAVNEDSDISAKGLKQQFDRLLLQPLLALDSSAYPVSTVAIVIDALDECDADDDMRLILQLLPRLQESKAVRLKVFLTSRPEWSIFQEFRKIIYEDVILHQIPEPVIQHDISLFLKHRLVKIRQTRSLSFDWPGDSELQKLVRLSTPLFIFAATICRLLEDPHWSPIETLIEVLSYQGYGSQLMGTYLPVLNSLLKGQTKQQKNKLVEQYQEIFGTIALLETPLSIVSLSKLLGVSEKHIQQRLGLLHSVLDIPEDFISPVRLFHISFRDFLFDPHTCEATPLWIDEKKAHFRLANKCLLLCEKLKKNICELPNDRVQRVEIDQQTIDDCLSPELQYACRYWAHHLISSKDHCMVEKTLSFLKKHYLHWIEAMGILCRVSDVLDILNSLQKATNEMVNSQLYKFLYDAKRFIMKNYRMASDIPLQIYSSGLVFAPQKSIVRKIFEKEIPNWICQLPLVDESWSSLLQILEDDSRTCDALAFLPDGRLVSGDGEKITIWDVTTSSIQRTLNSHLSYVRAMASPFHGQLLASNSEIETTSLWNTVTLRKTLDGFPDVTLAAVSPDGRLLAFVLGEWKLRILDIVTGDILNIQTPWFEAKFRPIARPRGIHSIAFSPNGQQLASGAGPCTIHLWDTVTGTLQRTLDTCGIWVSLLKFSPSGRQLATACEYYDHSILVWDTATGILEQTLKGEDRLRADSVAISPNGRLLASGHNYWKIRLWDIASGIIRQTIKGYSTGHVFSLAFSPDSRLLASGSEKILLWDISVDVRYHSLQSYRPGPRWMAFSADGRYLATLSEDSETKLWETKTGCLLHTLKSGRPGVVSSVAFSPNSQLLVVNMGEEGGIRVWEIATGTVLHTFRDTGSILRSSTFSPDSKLLATGPYEGQLDLYNPETGVLQETLGLSGKLSSAVFSHDGRLLAACDEHCSINIWTLGTPKSTVKYSFEGNLGLLWSVVFSSDSRMLVSSSADGDIKLWDMATGTLQQTLKGHERMVWSVALSPDDQLLASNSSDSTIQLWDTKTGNLLQTLRRDDFRYPLEFSNDGLILNTGQESIYVQSLIEGIHFSSQKSSSSTNMTILEEWDWIFLDGGKALWLPPEARPSCSAIKDNKIALANNSGRVFFIGFRMQ
ncbi:hypothetical protein N7466_001121 [Penicillium verhagenii]|uniref:uncharacterized protein n=1 Tax=Penicillium verhagenii TaxID=1562060 RepID=UPI0025450748|nr:uncharacterized protein N7466_001121 [Penicillium verhagenii]KAJ5948106.1 hypothetical protein N7466_001121 [Penicillium verhagenii]